MCPQEMREAALDQQDTDKLIADYDLSLRQIRSEEPQMV